MSELPLRDEPLPDAFALSQNDLIFFQANGYVGPFTLINEPLSEAFSEIVCGKRRLFRELDEVKFVNQQRSTIRKIKDAFSEVAYYYKSLVRHYSVNRQNGDRIAKIRPRGAPRYWNKNTRHLVSEVAWLGTRPEITQRLKHIIGPNILLWGSQLIVKQSRSHRWHEDVEHNRWQGASVWLGLNNVGPDNTMKVIPGSHLLGISPQELASEGGLDLQSDEQVLSAVQRRNPSATIVTMRMRPGTFFIFVGRTWHASHDVSDRARTAVIYQYCSPEERVQVPLNFELPRTRFHPAQPWVMIAAGEDSVGINHVRTPAAPVQGGLVGKTAIVTGGSRGIGLAIAAKLASKGAKVALLARDRDRLDAAARMLRMLYSADVMIYSTDLNDLTSVNKAIEGVQAEVGPIDILVNNAGLFQTLGPFWELDVDAWLSELSTNLVAPFLVARAVAKSMVTRRSGLIVNLAGGGAGQGIPFGSAYSAAKAGVVRLTECMAEDLKGTDVRVFGLDPGFVRTGMTIRNAESEAGKQWRPQVRRWLDAMTDVSPEHAAELIARLAQGAYPDVVGSTLFAAQSDRSRRLRFEDAAPISALKELSRSVKRGVMG